MQIWTGINDALHTDSLTHSQTLKDRATQLLIKYKNEARVTQCMVLIVKFTVKRKVVGGTVVGWDG